MDFRSYREFFRAIAHPTRFAIVQLLRQGPRNVTELYQQLGFEQSRVSHNLGCLSQCGFVRWQWQGKNKVYSLNPGIPGLLKVMDRHIQQYARELEACQVLDREARPVLIAASVRQGAGPGVRPSKRRAIQARTIKMNPQENPKSFPPILPSEAQGSNFQNRQKGEKL